MNRPCAAAGRCDLAGRLRAWGPGQGQVPRDMALLTPSFLAGAMTLASGRTHLIWCTVPLTWCHWPPSWPWSP